MQTTCSHALRFVLFFLLITMALCSLSCGAEPFFSANDTILLAPTADAGIFYQNRLTFFGESTTAHLAARGVLATGSSTHQVWRDESGTRMLSARGLSTPILDPKTGEKLTFSDACAKYQPEFLVLSFGINGILGFVENKESYLRNYSQLIQTAQAASPGTKIILQTVYPVCASGNFSVDTDTLNAHIETLNAWLPEIASSFKNVRVADTASVLRDTNGRLQTTYDAGDGLHLNAQAYRAILAYLREHAWMEGETT